VIRYKLVWIEDCPNCFVDVHSDVGSLERRPGQRIMALVSTELGLEVKVTLRWCACPTEQLFGPVTRS